MLHPNARHKKIEGKTHPTGISGMATNLLNLNLDFSQITISASVTVVS